jgi:HEAT repeat protein
LLALAPARADNIDNLARALTQDPSYKVRVQAALTLGKLKDRRAVQALIHALRDDNETVRGAAAASLGRIGDSSANAALEEATHDRNEFVSQQARKSLELIGKSRATATPGAKYYLAIGFVGNKPGHDVVRDTLAREHPKL